PPPRPGPAPPSGPFRRDNRRSVSGGRPAPPRARVPAGPGASLEKRRSPRPAGVPGHRGQASAYAWNSRALQGHRQADPAGGASLPVEGYYGTVRGVLPQAVVPP